MRTMTHETDRPSELPQAVIDYLWRGQTIEAIKLLRTQRKIGLKDAKDLVDDYVSSQPSLQQKMEKTQAEAKQILLRILIWLTIVAAGTAFVYFQGQ